MMRDEQLLITSIVLLFLMLWLPVGQHDFLINHWMKIGIYAIPFIGIGMFALRAKGNDLPLSSNFVFLAMVMLIAYIIHQFEEHWVDLLGNYYAFYSFNNNFILENLGQSNASIKPLTKESIFVINTSLVWLVGLLAVLRSPGHLFPLMAMASIVLINGLVHIIAGVAQFQYNPGLLTSVVIFIPLYLWTIKQIRHYNENYKALITGG